MQQDIQKAALFLREKNNTIPSEVIEFIKQTSLNALKKIESHKRISELTEKEIGEYIDILIANGVHTEALSWSQLISIVQSMRVIEFRS